MNPHILFVDDEAPIRELLSLFFRKKGLQVTTAISIEEGRAQVRGGNFDLVILDLHLAGENGLEFLTYLKREYPRLPVVIFTGMGSDQKLVAAAREGGACAFMSKTETLHKLLAEVTYQLELVGHRVSFGLPAPGPVQAPTVVAVKKP